MQFEEGRFALDGAVGIYVWFTGMKIRFLQASTVC